MIGCANGEYTAIEKKDSWSNFDRRALYGSTGRVPAAIHRSRVGTYFSAFGWLLHSTVRTDPSGKRVQVSSEAGSSLLAA